MAMHLLKIGVGHLCLGCQVAVSAVSAENRSEVCRNTHVTSHVRAPAPAGARSGTGRRCASLTRSRAGGLSGVTVWGQPAPGVRGGGRDA